jgi:hypothetical protein
MHLPGGLRYNRLLKAKDDDQYSDEETERRATEALRRALLTTPPKPQKEMIGKVGRVHSARWKPRISPAGFNGMRHLHDTYCGCFSVIQARPRAKSPRPGACRLQNGSLIKLRWDYPI